MATKRKRRKASRRRRTRYNPRAIPPDIAALRRELADWEKGEASRWHYRTKPGWRLCDRTGKVDCAALRDWVLDMTDWGKRVRHDILRLEAAAGLAKGDPGDPPPNPM